ncbi:uncharacterized protein LOC144647279 isoform X2 [Oculina patagonica]
MGGKNFPDEELDFKTAAEVLPTPIVPVNEPAPCSSHEALHEMPKAISTIRTTVELPDCLIYKGIHQWGFHLFWLESERYCRSLESSNNITDAISRVVGERWFMVVYRQEHGHTAYLPHQLSQAGDLFNHLCTRFALQLMRIIFYNPSWYVQVRLEEQKKTGEKLFSMMENMTNIKFLKKPAELAKWTGFPGNIQVPENFNL